MTRILHLVDDTNPGGVTRYLDFLASSPASGLEHIVRPVSRTRPSAGGEAADIIVSHLAVTWRGLPGLMALRGAHPDTPLVHVEHSYSAGFVACNVTARRRFHTLLRTAYALFDRVVAVSGAQGEWLRLRNLVRPCALSVIPPCVDLAPFRALPAPRQRRVIGAMGRFDPQKGFDLLIRAFRAVDDPSLTLRLIGDGAERAALEALAEGDARISFHGFAGDPAAAMAECDVIAMPSRWEPYGLVALEAMAAGRVLLVGAADGLADHAGSGAHAVRGAGTEVWRDSLSSLDEIAAAPRPDGAEEACRAAWHALARTAQAAPALAA
ncbi:glycosyltransferase family 4 protein [Tropicimonas sp. IMCC34011]|uniref:glycosyltransferase family 4 protein n=1 Tax=Tropicimonas sp. IMCC34011 TaxID=2248759 RepID=UPI000E275767|nr:glycosyltransferase family 4 protein [Tropicimonas sp. IMCC34011]